MVAAKGPVLLLAALMSLGCSTTVSSGEQDGGRAAPDANAVDTTAADANAADTGPTPPDATVCATQPQTLGGISLPLVGNLVDQVDLLLEVDNSNSMRENQVNLARNLRVMIDQFVNPPLDPATQRPRFPPVRSLHVGVISSDLGTAGSVVPSCANSDGGDDGLLNPIRNGPAIRAHQPWTTAQPGVRPMRCENRPDQFPNFLTFDAQTSNPTSFAEEMTCNALLSGGGCGLEQQLESAYRALVVRNAREGVPGNMDPNAGFVRDNAVLAIVMLTDEEDGSVRDCRFREPLDPDGTCPSDGSGNRLGVFDVMNPNWASADLNLRLYMYTPGSAQDPTWPLNRYIDPARPDRGFTGLKPGRPDLVVFSAVAGVPINLPQRAGTTNPQDPANIDWTALLGSRPDGSDGFTGMTPEGPVSMRQRNADMNCATRVVPSCRREGSTYDPMACDTTRQYFAWPSRRIAEVARRFAVTYGTGALSSICRNDFTPAVQLIAERVQRSLGGRCLSRPLPTINASGASRVDCVVEESLPSTVRAATWCVPARGRRPGGVDFAGRERCTVNQVAAIPGQAPPPGEEGFFYDTRPDPSAPDCAQRISFTANATLAPGATATVSCVARVEGAPATTQQCGPGPVGATCDPTRPAPFACDPARGESRGCFLGRDIYLGVGARECTSGLCLVNRFSEASAPAEERPRRVHCTCRCAPPQAPVTTVDPRTLCACPTGFVCRANLAGAAFGDALAGGYCVRDGT